MRVATIDIGTNTVLLLVAERGPGGQLGAVAERATITRLGEGVDRTGHLATAAIARTVECLRDYAALARRLDVQRVAVVGTSAMRDASGGEAIRDAVKERLGVDARVISGDEEARLTFRGSLSGLGIDPSKDYAVFDIGGGSTEVVIGRIDHGQPAISWAQSFDIGSVRLTERHGEDRRAIDRAAIEAFVHVPPLPGSAEPIAIAGTMTTLTAVSLALVPYDGSKVHGHVISRRELADVVARLASLNTKARGLVPGMEPKRADVILAGGFIAMSLLDHWGASAVRISDRGVRWGLAEELAEGGPSGSH